MSELIFAFSIISLFACLVGSIILVVFWKGIYFSKSINLIVLLLFLLFGFNAVTNTLEYSGVTENLDFLGDISQGLQPLMWGLLLYGLMLRIIEKDRKEIESKILVKNKVLERKTQQLEKFAKVAIGREEKMIELKKRIVEYEKS